MKRKNILKFVSLLGIGSFVMLAAASCSQANTSTPNPNSSSDSGRMTDNMSSGNTNPGGATMNNVDPALAAARMALSTLHDSKAENTGLYVDYAKIQNALTKAYDDAKAVLDNSSSTKQSFDDAKTKLEAAISAADKAKKDFDEKNTELVTAYSALKETLKQEKSVLDSLEHANYAWIKNNLNNLYEKAKVIVTATLDPISGSIPETNSVTDANTNITNAVSRNEPWKKNADNLVNSFIKVALAKDKLENIDETNKKVQPGNYGFVTYGIDISNLNWSFAQRVIWNKNNQPIETPVAEEGKMATSPLSDVSWIYSLAGENAKYTLSFRYFGPSKDAWLYFPYKLVKSGDASNVALQYKLNEGDVKAVDFQTDTSASTGGPAAAAAASSSIRLVDSHESMPTAHAMNEAPTVGDIKVAKVHLSDLKFNLNTVEFSVQSNKVAPMIGNMYLTSSDKEDNKNKIYNDIFGNSVKTENGKTEISINTLSAYSLAQDWSTYIKEFSDDEFLMLDDQKSTDKFYLIGFVGGNAERGTNISNDGENSMKMPRSTDKRTYTFYVNAPQNGQYYIKGIYASGQNRSLKFMTGNSSVTITNLNSTDFNTKLKTFDTSKSDSTVDNMKNTLMLKKGLNKIVVSGGDINGDAPNFGNLSFTLMNQAMAGSK